MKDRLNQESAAKSSAHMHEGHLLRAVQKERNAALADLYQLRRKTVLKTLHGITRNREDAEDALQDSFLRALVHFDDFQNRSSLTTWFTRIAINSGLMLIREKRASREAPQSGEASETLEISLPDKAPGPEIQYLRAERAKLLHGALQDLRPSLRGAIEMRYLRDLTAKESSLRAGISVTALKARLYHGKTALRRSAQLRALSRTAVRMKRPGHCR